MEISTSPNKFSILQQYFGHKTFRSGQETLIDNLLAHRDVLA